MKEEIWKTIIYNGIEYENYAISTHGRIMNKKTGNILKCQMNSCGYYIITLKKKRMKIHRLVAISFIPNPENKEQVNHIDGNKTNNHIDNLEWNTQSENMQHAASNNLLNIKKGSNHVLSKLKEEDVIFIKSNYIARDKIFGGVALSRKFGVCSTIISDIINGKKWKHIHADNGN